MWDNRDVNFHTVTSTISSGPASNKMFPGKAYSFTFRRVGTFTYFCQFHPSEVGTVTVVDNSPGAAPSTTTTTTPPSATKQSTATPNSGTTTGASSSSSSSSASATANAVVVNNPPPQQTQTTTTTKSTPPAVKQQPIELPATGVSDTVTVFGVAAAVGAIMYGAYSYIRRKLIRGQL